MKKQFASLMIVAFCFGCEAASANIDLSLPNHTQEELDKYSIDKYNRTGRHYDHYIVGQVFNAIKECAAYISEKERSSVGDEDDYDYIIKQESTMIFVTIHPKFKRLSDVEVNDQGAPLYGYLNVRGFVCKFDVNSQKIVRIDELIM